ncbi:SDR family oxidoreductase [Mycolicibacterium sp. 624]|uniref:SDR family oxidoreductase n=1 Tax=Mycolicibacterium sp. 624 TaxID=3156314 RepID=UPI0033953C06
MARLLHQRGARLLLIDADGSSLQTLAEELGDAVVACAGCDVNDFDGRQAAVDAAMGRFGRIDVVMANAGVEHWAPVCTVDPQEFRQVIETNVIGVFNTVRAALPSLLDRQGYILVVASVSSYTAMPGMASYGASKAGAEQFANVLRVELAGHGVAVGTAHMSLVDTPMLRETQSKSTQFTELVSTLPTLMSRTVTADHCASRLVDAIEHRRRHVDVPRWVAVTRWLKPLLVTSLAQRPTAQQFRRIEARSKPDTHGDGWAGFGSRR